MAKDSGNTEQQSNSLVATTYCFLSSALPYILNLLITLIMGTFIATIYTKLKLFLTAF